MKWIRVIAFFLCGLISAQAAKEKAPAKPAEFPADAAAMVNGEKIPENIVQAFLQNDLQISGAAQPLPGERDAMLQDLIDRVLVAQEVKKRHIEPSEAQLDEAEKKMIEYLRGERQYEAFVRQNHFTRAEYRKYVLANAAASEALKKDLTKNALIPPAEIRDYFNAHKYESAFQWPERVTGAHILFNTQRDFLASRVEHARPITDKAEMEKAIALETESRRKLANEVRTQAIGGADFAQLAAKYSDDAGTKNDGGNLSSFARGTHSPALDDAFFRLRSGEIGPVVQSEYGFHVIKTIEHKPAETRTLEESTPEIQSRLANEKAARLMRDCINTLHTNAFIVMKAEAPEKN
ncbi:MAG: peptidylprolyl isomerase [Verrucomicrobiota bacterium]|nr:peptidylprolyl isomerase [Verrucomicrobiota bacterium]